MKGQSSPGCVRDALWQQLLVLLVTTAKVPRDTPGLGHGPGTIINCPDLHYPVLGGEVFEKSKYFDSESVTSLKAISRNLVLLIAKQYLEKDSIFSNI